MSWDLTNWWTPKPFLAEESKKKPNPDKGNNYKHIEFRVVVDPLDTSLMGSMVIHERQRPKYSDATLEDILDVHIINDSIDSGII